MYKNKTISLVLPAFNEQINIKQSIEEFLGTGVFDEIIVIDNNSSDNTAVEIKKTSATYIIEKNQGYGAAIITGIKESKYEWILQTDGDNQYDINDFNEMKKILHNYDCIITFRYKKIYESHRIFISWIYNKIVQIIFKSRFRDISTGLRLIKKSCLKDIDLISSSSFIGAEIAIRLMLKGYQVGEMGINTYPRIFGTSSILTFKSISSTIKDLIRLKKLLFN